MLHVYIIGWIRLVVTVARTLEILFWSKQNLIRFWYDPIPLGSFRVFFRYIFLVTYFHFLFLKLWGLNYELNMNVIVCGLGWGARELEGWGSSCTGGSPTPSSALLQITYPAEMQASLSLIFSLRTKTSSRNVFTSAGKWSCRPVAGHISKLNLNVVGCMGSGGLRVYCH